MEKWQCKWTKWTFQLFFPFPLHLQLNEVYFGYPWYDLHGWLGVKNQWSIYLVVMFVCCFSSKKLPSWCRWGSRRPPSSTRNAQRSSRSPRAPRNWTSCYKVSGQQPWEGQAADVVNNTVTNSTMKLFVNNTMTDSTMKLLIIQWLVGW